MAIFDQILLLARQRRRRSWLVMAVKVLIWVGLSLVALQVLWTFHLAGVNIPAVEVDPITGQERIRKRPGKLFKTDPSTGKHIPTSPFDGVMESYLTLTHIEIPESGLVSSSTAAGGEQKYTGVKAYFCHISWSQQDQNPNAVPLFRDLIEQSPLCAATRFSADLWEITRQATDYDYQNHTFAATKAKHPLGSVPPTAVIFHESRCGSTLLSNVLAAYMPQHSRVYAEAPAPLAALRACDGPDAHCDEGAHDALIRDVFYLSGRTHGQLWPQHVFYKMQSTGVYAISALGRAMPQTPWVFVYRHSVEILMSHLKDYQMGHPLSDSFLPNCLRNYGKNLDQQPAFLQELVASKNMTVSALSKDQYCAAHIGSLALAAVRHHQATRKSKAHPRTVQRWFINYNTLPYAAWETILKDLMGTITHDELDHMHQVGKYYAMGRTGGDHEGEHWHEDSTVKRGMAPPAVVEAAGLFVDPLYRMMEDFKHKIETGEH